jgi:hypothetical protein
MRPPDKRTPARGGRRVLSWQAERDDLYRNPAPHSSLTAVTRNLTLSQGVRP